MQIRQKRCIRRGHKEQGGKQPILASLVNIVRELSHQCMNRMICMRHTIFRIQLVVLINNKCSTVRIHWRSSTNS